MCAHLCVNTNLNDRLEIFSSAGEPEIYPKSRSLRLKTEEVATVSEIPADLTRRVSKDWPFSYRRLNVSFFFSTVVDYNVTQLILRRFLVFARAYTCSPRGVRKVKPPPLSSGRSRLSRSIG